VYLDAIEEALKQGFGGGRMSTEGGYRSDSGQSYFRGYALGADIPGRSVNCAAEEKARRLMSNVIARPVIPDAAKIIATTTN